MLLPGPALGVEAGLGLSGSFLVLPLVCVPGSVGKDTQRVQVVILRLMAMTGSFSPPLSSISETGQITRRATQRSCSSAGRGTAWRADSVPWPLASASDPRVLPGASPSRSPHPCLLLNQQVNASWRNNLVSTLVAKLECWRGSGLGRRPCGARAREPGPQVELYPKGNSDALYLRFPTGHEF